MNIFIAILVFGIIIVVHELGHFWAARACGVLVEEFAVGFGPKLLSTKRGDTVYSLRLVPAGGFCKMYEGINKTLNEPENDENPNLINRGLLDKPVWQRIIIMASGAVLNALLAFIVLFGLNALFFEQGSETGTIIVNIAEGLPAAEAGLLPGDKINRVNDVEITFHGISGVINNEMRSNPGQPLEFEIIRNGLPIIFNIEPSYNPGPDGSPGSYRLGVVTNPERRTDKIGLFARMPEGENITRAGLGETIHATASECVFMVRSIYGMLSMLFTREASVGEMVGPIGLVNVMGDIYQQTAAISAAAVIHSMLLLMALISINLAVLNLLPLPALDGGKIIFLLIEAVRKKPLNPEKEGMIHFAGLVLLMVLAVYLAFNDIRNII